MKKYKTVEECSKLYVWDVLKTLNFKRGEKPKSIDISINDRVAMKVDLVPSKTNFQGLRLWFSCPSCNRRVGALYCPPYGDQVLLCRHCLGLRYEGWTRHREAHYEEFRRLRKKGK